MICCALQFDLTHIYTHTISQYTEVCYLGPRDATVLQMEGVNTLEPRYNAVIGIQDMVQ